MTNVELLEAKIQASGKKKKHLAQRCGMTPNGFRNCCTNVTEFRASHIQVLCEELGITDLAERQAIFFAGVVH